MEAVFQFLSLMALPIVIYFSVFAARMGFLRATKRFQDNNQNR